jgi:rod shape-determining protein MreC
MSSSRDDFGIAFRSALLQKGAAQKFSLVSLIILAIIIFFLDIYNFSFMKPVRSLVNDGIYRISLVTSSPLRFLPNLSNEISTLINIKKENIKLKDELAQYRTKELNIEYLASQNKVLNKFLKDESISEESEKIIFARVLLDKKSPYLQSIIINKGSKAGVLKGMPILDRDFLIGRVVETNYLSSRVLLLNDLNSRIPVTLGKEGVQAILKGNGGSKPILEYLPEEYKVEEGLNIFTSGKDQIFTKGTPVGSTNINGEVILFSDSRQLSYIKIDLRIKTKETF